MDYIEIVKKLFKPYKNRTLVCYLGVNLV